MDALAEARTQLEHSLQTGANELAQVAKAAKGAGVDPAQFLGPLGTFLTGTPERTITRSTAGRRGRVRPAGSQRRGGGGGRGNGAPTGEQIVTLLQQHGPMNQSQLATHFGVTRQTIANRVKTLGGQVIRDGNKWRAPELAGVGA